MSARTQQARAVVLATVMLLSMVGGVATFGGTTGAQIDSGGISVDDDTVGAQTSNDATQNSDGGIVGVVTDASTGESIGNATVVAVQNREVVGETTTDSRGEYNLSVPEGNYTVGFSASGYLEQQVTGVSVLSNDTTEVNAQLEPDDSGGSDGTIAGGVIDASTGEAITDAQVAVFDGDTLVTETLTDSNGNYGLSVAEGTYTVVFEAQGYTFRERNNVSVVAGDTTTVDAELEPDDGGGGSDGTLVGVVADASSGDAIADAQVVVFDGESVVAETTTGTDGSYEVSVAEGTYTVGIEAEGYNFHEEPEVSVAANESTTVDAQLEPKADPDTGVTGIVTDEEDGSAVSEASVAVIDPDTGEFVAGDQTDSNGEYMIGVEAGEYDVIVEARGYSPETVGTRVENGSLTDVPIALVPDDGSDGDTGSVVGGVMDEDGYAYGGAELVFENDTESWSTTSQSDGFFSIDLPSGEYDVTVTADGYGTTTDAIVVEAGQVIEREYQLQLDLDNGTVSGTVGDAENRDGLEGATVYLLPEDGSFQDVLTTTTDAEGSFDLTTRAGEYMLFVDADGYHVAETQVSIPENDDTAVSIPLEPQSNVGTVTGTVTDGDGTAVEGATVMLQNPNGGLDGIAVTDGSGAYQVDGTEGDRVVEVMAEEGYASNSVSVAANSTVQADLQLDSSSGSGTFEGVVLDAETGDPITGATVEVKQDGSVVKNTTTDSDGLYQLSVPGGTYDVTFSADGYESETLPDVPVEDDSTTVLDFDLIPGIDDTSGTATVTGRVIDNDGNGIENVTVQAFGDSIVSTTTDEDGTYAIEVGTMTRELRVGMESDQWGGELVPIRPAANETITVDVELGSTGTLEIAVVDGNGDPIEGATVFADRRSESAQGTTDTQGTVSFDVGAGDYWVDVIDGQKPALSERGVTVREGETTQLELEYPSLATIEGSVELPDGSTPNGAHVQIQGDNGMFFAPTDPSGNFSKQVFAGNYTVTAFDSAERFARNPVDVSVDANGTATTGPITIDTIQVQNANIEAVGPTDPDIDQFDVQAEAMFGALHVTVADDRSRAPISDLSKYNVTNETVFEITVTVSNYDPDSLFWAGDNVAWSAQENATDPSLTDVTITVSPVNLEIISNRGIGMLGGQSPDQVNWPTGGDDVADMGWDQAVALWLIDLDAAAGPRTDSLTGTTVTTNAQRFSQPRMVNGSLEVWVAGPSVGTDGEEHDGFYRAFIPDSQLNEWDIEDPEIELAAKYKGSEAAIDVNETDDGAWIELDISYSAGTVEIEPEPDAAYIEASTVEVDPGSVTDGETTTVTATLENIGGSTTENTVSLSVGAEVLAEKTVSLGANDTTTVEFTVDTTDLSVGDREVTVDTGDEVANGTLTVDPSAETYANKQDVVDTGGLRDAVDDWRSGVLSTDVLLSVIDHWQAGTAIS